MTVEIWASLVSDGSSQEPRGIAVRAKRLEADGWDGGVLADSQTLAAEAFTVLAWCAAATTTLKLGTGTSNPATRHPSVIASAAAALQVASEGRMTLSIGRGDSSLAFIGAPPVPLGYFERSLATIHAYLRGDEVPIADAASFLGSLPTTFDNLAIGTAPEASRLRWLPNGYRKPEFEVVATGPKVIAMAARHADRIALAVGGDVKRLAWGMAEARRELEKLGRDPASVTFAAIIPFYPHPDEEFARQLAQGMVASMSRFSIMNKKVVGPVSEDQRANLERVASSYDMKHHGANASKQAQALDPEFIDTFGVVGDPARCVDRLLEIAELGISKLILWTAGSEGRPGESYRVAVEDVIPKIHN
jgi:5,10-methylenetetrahydromethanopterin reductase